MVNGDAGLNAWISNGGIDELERLLYGIASTLKSSTAVASVRSCEPKPRSSPRRHGRRCFATSPRELSVEMQDWREESRGEVRMDLKAAGW